MRYRLIARACMGWAPAGSASAAPTALAQRALRENALRTEQLRAALPRHCDLIRKIVEHGLQPV
jgi:tryptophan 7-halogenase